jgi:hypothetical protein
LGTRAPHLREEVSHAEKVKHSKGGFGRCAVLRVGSTVATLP